MMTEAGDIYLKLSEKHNLSVDQIRNIIIYFWRTGVKRSLENIVNREIYISKLGSFKLKDWKLKYMIPSSYGLARKPDQHERNIEYFNFLNERLIQMEKDILDRKLRKQYFNEFNKQDSRDISKQKIDLGRAQE